jgi:hypothetical protein
VPSWYYAPHLDYVKAAKLWSIDPDRWDELTDEAKGEIVAEYRTERLMSAWEAHVFKPRATG